MLRLATNRKWEEKRGAVNQFLLFTYDRIIIINYLFMNDGAVMRSKYYWYCLGTYGSIDIESTLKLYRWTQLNLLSPYFFLRSIKLFKFNSLQFANCHWTLYLQLKIHFFYILAISNLSRKKNDSRDAKRNSLGTMSSTQFFSLCY